MNAGNKTLTPCERSSQPVGASQRLIEAAQKFLTLNNACAGAEELDAALKEFAASRQGAGALPAEQWLPMETAPTDGTMVRLLVDYSGEHGCNPLEDADQAQTIGANNDSNVGDNEGKGWEFAGWNWQQDHFTHGCGTPIGWLPFVAPSAALATPSPAQAEPTEEPQDEVLCDCGRPWGDPHSCAYQNGHDIYANPSVTSTGAAEGAEPIADADRKIQWPKENRVGRREDMSPDGTLIVGLDSDNDVYIEVSSDRHGQWQTAAVEFCNGGGGGGQSSATRAALINLMTAIEADNEKAPHKAFPGAARAAQKGQP